MALYRCAVCGSPRVMQTTEKDGFSYGKAAVGTAVFGVVGAVAGLDGKKQQVFRCPDCGHTMAQPMDAGTKEKIEACLRNEEIRLQLNWNQLKSRYPNIETGIADRVIAAGTDRLEQAIQTVLARENAAFLAMQNMSEEELDADEAEVRREEKAFNDEIDAEAQALVDAAVNGFEEKRQALIQKTEEAIANYEQHLAEIGGQSDGLRKAVKKAKKGALLGLLVYVVGMVVVIALSSMNLQTPMALAAVAASGGFIYAIVRFLSFLMQLSARAYTSNALADARRRLSL